MMNNGWIKLHTRILESPIFEDHYLLQLVVYLLMTANWKNRKIIMGNTVIELKRGQLITGRKAITHALTKLKDENSPKFKKMEFFYYRKMILLEKLGFLYIKSTSKYSIITIQNYNYYQDNIQEQHNNDTTTAQQLHTPKDIKTNNISKDISTIWDFYIFYKKSKERLTKGRVVKIKERLNTFTVEEIKTAIEQCFKSKFHTGGNDRGWKAAADYVFRSDEVVDRLINLDIQKTNSHPEYMDAKEMKEKGLTW